MALLIAIASLIIFLLSNTSNKRYLLTTSSPPPSNRPNAQPTTSFSCLISLLAHSPNPFPAHPVAPSSRGRLFSQHHGSVTARPDSSTCCSTAKISLRDSLLMNSAL
uniref:(northern house mosquito) hypothetical protein n=1 Tax=Culex pipiens TaxID=7175 RepID=A0A8D8G4E2_CULPI